MLNARLDGLAAEHAEQVEANIADLKTTDIHRSRLGVDGVELPATSRQIATHMADLDRDTRTASSTRSRKKPPGKDYYKHSSSEGWCRCRPPRTLRVEVAALFEIPVVVQSLEARATDWVREQLDAFKVEIDNTTGARRDGFRRVQEQALTPEARNGRAARQPLGRNRRRRRQSASQFPGHIYSDENGEFPVASH